MLSLKTALEADMAVSAIDVRKKYMYYYLVANQIQK
jgi:hypothetical protein